MSISPRELAAALVAIHDEACAKEGTLPVDPVFAQYGRVVAAAREWLEAEGEEITNVVSATLPEYGGPNNVYVNGVFVVGVTELRTTHVEGQMSRVTLTLPAKFIAKG